MSARIKMKFHFIPEILLIGWPDLRQSLSALSQAVKIRTIYGTSSEGRVSQNAY